MKLNKNEIVDARDWLLDCCVDDQDAEFIENDCSDEDIERLVSRHYPGGLDGFLFSYGPLYKREA